MRVVYVAYAYNSDETMLTGLGGESAEISDPRQPTKMEPVRLNLNLSKQVKADLDQLSESTGLSLTEIVRFGLRLARFCWELGKEEKLGVFNKDGELLREIVPPWAPRQL